MAEYKVTFAYIKGRWYSFPSVEAARSAVDKYTGNMDSVTHRKPSGVAINTTLGWSTDGEFADMSQWPDQVFAPEGVTGDALWNPPNNPITVGTTIVDDTTTTTTTDTTDTTGGGDQVIDSDDVSGVLLDDEVDILDWSGLDQELLNLAKRYATAGMLGRAKAAFVKAGGTWSDAIEIALKEGGEDKEYGGTIAFDWASLGVNKALLQTIKDLAKQGKYGQISKLMEDEEGNTTFNKDVHQKLQAFVHMGDKVDWDTVTGQGGDTTGRDDSKEVTKTSKTTRSVGTGPAGAGGTYDITTGKLGEGETIADLTGKYATGQARLDAKEWRARQVKKLTETFGADPKTMSGADRKAWKKKKDQIILRHGKMIQK